MTSRYWCDALTNWAMKPLTLGAGHLWLLMSSNEPFKSAVQYMKHFIYHFTSILHGLTRTHKWPAPNVSGFIAQLVRASHRYHEVTGSNPVEVLTFSGFYTQLLKIIIAFIPYLPVYKSTFYNLKICPKNRPQLIHGSKTEIKESWGQN